MSGLGTQALEYGGRVDFARLRAERQARLLRALREAKLDALVLGREANARYAAGARRLWTAGGRPFGPGCVVLADTGAVHLMSSWDEGVPAELPREQLYGTTWNPDHLAAALARIDGLARARRVGVDGMSPAFARMLPGVAPKADLFDAAVLLEGVRRIKTPDEIACIETATAIAEGALDRALDALRVGVSERELLGAFLSAAAAAGVTTPSFEGTFRACGPGDAAGRLCRDRAVRDGEPVICDVGLLYAGYEGGVARTRVCGSLDAAAVDLAGRTGELQGRLIEACRPGASAADLARIHTGTASPTRSAPIVHGVGLGTEPPIAAPGAPADPTPLEPGMVIAVSATLADPGAGTWSLRDLVHITAEGPRRLNR